MCWPTYTIIIMTDYRMPARPYIFMTSASRNGETTTQAIERQSLQTKTLHDAPTGFALRKFLSVRFLFGI